MFVAELLVGLGHVLTAPVGGSQLVEVGEHLLQGAALLRVGGVLQRTGDVGELLVEHVAAQPVEDLLVGVGRLR